MKTRVQAALLCAVIAALLAPAAHAQEALIRKNLPARLPSLPKIDEVRATSFPGLYEVRMGQELAYTDARGDHLIQGELTDTRSGANLTELRVRKLTAIDFASLPLQDAIVWKSGSGERKLAIFADPNCGYCKRFERTLQEVKDVTVYTFVIPILGGDSPEKAKAIWCARDNTAVWRGWMLEGKAPAAVAGPCDTSVLDRNVALSNKLHVNGTPALVFGDGGRVSGAVSAEEAERQFRIARNGS